MTCENADISPKTFSSLYSRHLFKEEETRDRTLFFPGSVARLLPEMQRDAIRHVSDRGTRVVHSPPKVCSMPMEIILFVRINTLL